MHRSYFTLEKAKHVKILKHTMYMYAKVEPGNVIQTAYILLDSLHLREVFLSFTISFLHQMKQ